MVLNFNKSKRALLKLVLALTIPLLLLIAYNYTFGPKQVAVLHINGPIDSQTAVQMLDRLDHLAAARHIGALVLRINSPGGNSASSEELYRSVKELSDSGTAVVISMGDMATSGGYYVASAGDYIYASASTLTGSIGVIIELPNYQGLYDKLGISYEIIKSGSYKDAGHNSRDLSPEEHELFLSIVMETWEQFVTDVSISRKIPFDQLAPYADGRVLTGTQALKIGLIDEIGGLADAIKKARLLANSGPKKGLQMLEPVLAPLERPPIQLRF